MLQNSQATRSYWCAISFLTAVLILVGAVAPSCSPEREPPPPWVPVPEPYIPSPFALIEPPNPTRPWAVLAIVPTPLGRPQQAASLARFTRKNIRKSPKWKGMTIYVFSDAKSAQVFRNHQKERRGEPLQQADYAALTHIWPKALACYIYSQGKEKVLYPSKNPKAWWRRL